MAYAFSRAFQHCCLLVKLLVCIRMYIVCVPKALGNARAASGNMQSVYGVRRAACRGVLRRAVEVHGEVTIDSWANEQQRRSSVAVMKVVRRFATSGGEEGDTDAAHNSMARYLCCGRSLLAGAHGYCLVLVAGRSLHTGHFRHALTACLDLGALCLPCALFACLG